MRLSRILAFVVSAAAIAGANAAVAKAHHEPMAPLLSVQCSVHTGSELFLCLRPGLVSVLADLRGLSHTFSSPTACSPSTDGDGNVTIGSNGLDSCGGKPKAE